jgi:RNA polymerase sigma-B factor
VGLSKQEARRLRTKELFLRLRETGDNGARDEIISLHIDLVDYLARRFINRGEPFEDLLQVGCIGLIKSIDRYDLDRGVEFSTYATPTILGELKRHLRDKGRPVRIPRRLQAMGIEFKQQVEKLTQELGRSPTLKEVSTSLDASVEEVIETIESESAMNHLSLDTTIIKDDRQTFRLIDCIGDDSDYYSIAEDREAIGRLISGLPAREQKLIFMRYFMGMTQAEIAQVLDISQMHVSRLLNKTLIKLKGEARIEEIND